MEQTIETEDQRQFRLASMQLAQLFAQLLIDPFEGVNIGWLKAQQETAGSPLVGKLRFRSNATGRHWEIAFTASAADGMYLPEICPPPRNPSLLWQTTDGQMVEAPSGYGIQAEPEAPIVSTD